jgi:hypothetical protein
VTYRHRLLFVEGRYSATPAQGILLYLCAEDWNLEEKKKCVLQATSQILFWGKELFKQLRYKHSTLALSVVLWYKITRSFFTAMCYCHDIQCHRKEFSSICHIMSLSKVAIQNTWVHIVQMCVCVCVCVRARVEDVSQSLAFKIAASGCRNTVPCKFEHVLHLPQSEIFSVAGEFIHGDRQTDRQTWRS